MFKILKFSPGKIESTSEVKDGWFVWTVSPLISGMSHSVVHPLRRFLLSFFPAYAPYALKINNVSHEYEPIAGVNESVFDVVKNLVCVEFSVDQKNFDSAPKDFVAKLSCVSQGDIKAGMLELDTPLVKISNPDHVLFYKNDESLTEMSIFVNFGSGFVTKEENLENFAYRAKDAIFLDSNYSKVDDFKYSIQEHIVDKFTVYESLSVYIKPRGGIDGQSMVSFACSYLSHVFKSLSGEKKQSIVELDFPSEASKEKDVERPIDISTLNLSNRSLNCLQRNQIHDLKQLTEISRKELEKIKHLGKVSMREILAVMKENNLNFRDE